MKRYYLVKEKGLDSLSLPNETKERINFLIGSPQDYYFGLRNLVLKCGFKIPSKFEKETFLHEGTYCPVFFKENGKRYSIAKIVFKESKNGKNNGDGKSKEETKEKIYNLTQVISTPI